MDSGHFISTGDVAPVNIVTTDFNPLTQDRKNDEQRTVGSEH